MAKNDLIKNLKDYFILIKDLHKNVSDVETVQVINKELKSQIEQLSSTWFEQFAKTLIQSGLENEVLEKYNSAFKILLKLSGNNNRKTSYLAQFDSICKSFREDIIINMQINSVDRNTSVENKFNDEVVSMLDKISDKDDNEYLRESLGCWKYGFLKASIVLVWCAAMDRIHKVIEQKGFDKFNKVSEVMKTQTKGRFKNFNKTFNVQSINDLQMIFDSDILWILEGMEMIDSNQKTRLSSCFELRCHSGHPGDAPITKYNVLSCFSDIIEIILANPTFSISLK